MGFLTTDTGRIRLGWRLLIFVFLALSIGLVLASFAPPGLLAGSFGLLVGSLAAGWFLLSLDGRGPTALGLHPSLEAPGELLRGLVLGIGIGLGVVVLMALFGGVRWSSEPGDAAAWVIGAAGSLAFLAIPAAAEEALLRGYPLQALGEAWGAWLAVVITSIVFALLHVANPGWGPLSLANIAAAGVLLGVVYVRTLSLWWATGAHLGWNWAHGYVADLPVSGLELIDAPLYEGVTTGPTWLGGGSFGPEGSVISTVVLIVASAGLWWGPWLEPGRTMRRAEALMAPATTAEGSATPHSKEGSDIIDTEERTG